MLKRVIIVDFFSFNGVHTIELNEGVNLLLGINGSGKTNSILSVLHSLSTSDIPFMVIEPAKTEYVDWALKYNDKLQEDQMNGLRLIRECKKT